MKSLQQCPGCIIFRWSSPCLDCQLSVSWRQFRFLRSIRFILPNHISCGNISWSNIIGLSQNEIDNDYQSKCLDILGFTILYTGVHVKERDNFIMTINFLNVCCIWLQACVRWLVQHLHTIGWGVFSVQILKWTVFYRIDHDSGNLLWAPSSESRNLVPPHWAFLDSKIRYNRIHVITRNIF